MPSLTEYLKSLSSLESKETTPLTLVLSGTLLEGLNVWQATSSRTFDEASELHYLYQWLSVHGKRVTTLKLEEYNPVSLEKAGQREYSRWISNYNKDFHNQAQASEGYLSYRWGRGERVDNAFNYNAHGFVDVTRLPDPLHNNKGALAAEPHSLFLNSIFEYLSHVKFLFLSHCVFASKRFILSFEKAFPALTHFSQSASESMPFLVEIRQSKFSV